MGCDWTPLERAIVNSGFVLRLVGVACKIRRGSPQKAGQWVSDLSTENRHMGKGRAVSNENTPMKQKKKRDLVVERAHRGCRLRADMLELCKLMSVGLRSSWSSIASRDDFSGCGATQGQTKPATAHRDVEKRMKEKVRPR